MKNATELYKLSGKTDKQAPGPWLRRKDVKKILDRYEDKLTACKKDAEGQWLFDDNMYDLYSLYITPKEREMPADVKQITQPQPQEWYDSFMQQFKKDSNEEVYEYLFKKAVEDLLQLNYVKISKFGVKDLWCEATPPVKRMLASFLSACNTRIISYNKKVDTHFMDGLRREFAPILDKGEISRITKTYFESEDNKVFINHRNDLVSVKNEK